MLQDGHIRLLSLHVSNKIAAGEVVERPASVVKELMENAIDAGATRLEITVTAGGRKLIEVRDNGCGMGRDDALLCLERQATSKIHDVDDIERINTLGFRGEAIPSIASVARFSLKTRRASEQAGTELVVVGGTLQEVRAVGVPPGTTVAVRDLFFNVPARRKFLRAYQTELAHIKNVFTLHALAHPHVGMVLSSDGRDVLRLPAGASPEERAHDIFGSEFCARLRPVQGQVGELSVRGFVSLPDATRMDRSEQYIFVNRRPATAPIIAYALKQAYPSLEQQRKPIVLLFLELPPERVDVNVHPTKREVRFHRPGEVRDLIIRAISQALAGGAHVPTVGLTPPTPGMVPGTAGIDPAAGTPLPAVAGTPGEGTPGATTLTQLAPEAAGAARPFDYPGASDLAAIPIALPPPPEALDLPVVGSEDERSPWRWCRVLGDLGGRYVLLETDDGLVTLDPQAARERVLYEVLLARLQEEKTVSQRLLLPESVKLEARDAARLRQHLSVVQAMGFEVEDFGNDYFIVEALPDVLGTVSCRELLGNIAHDLESAGRQRGAAKWREELVAKAACRAYVRTEGSWEAQAIQELVNQLATTHLPYTCPRGRPTMIFTSYRELERKFGR